MIPRTSSSGEIISVRAPVRSSSALRRTAGSTLVSTIATFIADPSSLLGGSLARLGPGRRPIASVLAHDPAQDVDAMVHDRLECGQRIPHTAGRARQVDDERPMPSPSHPARERSPREGRQTQRPDPLGDPRRIPFDRRPGGLRRHIPQTNPVPPVVSTRSAASSSLHATSRATISPGLVRHHLAQDYDIPRPSPHATIARPPRCPPAHPGIRRRRWSTRRYAWRSMGWIWERPTNMTPPAPIWQVRRRRRRTRRGEAMPRPPLGRRRRRRPPLSVPVAMAVGPTPKRCPRIPADPASATGGTGTAGGLKPAPTC